MDVELSRRHLLSLGGAGVIAVGVEPPRTRENDRPHPDRGAPTEYTGADLARIGMPVGGGCSGQVYLAGDGRLWNWDIFNPLGPPLGGADHWGSHYASPVTADSPAQFAQGFAIRTTANGATQTRTLDSDGFDDVRFVGQYPIGRVRYRARATSSPVDVVLEAFSPFIPLQTDDSTLPATILAFTVRNTTKRSVDVTLLGFTENPVCVNSRREQPTTLRASAVKDGKVRGVQFSAALPTATGERPDVVFEDWEKDTYEGWTVTGDAFGTGPVHALAVPSFFRRFGNLNVCGTRFVTSHHFRGGGDGDSYQGTLTSVPFTVSRSHVAVSIGGGNHPGATCVNVLVDGQVVATSTGANCESMVPAMLDISAYEGKTAQLQLVDNAAGAWAHLNVDRIVFTDSPDILFEDWERTDWGDWTVAGDAFGAGPVTPAETPEGFRRPFGEINDLNVSGARFATSFNFRAPGASDSYQGTLTSQPFTIQRRFATIWIGGGRHPGETGVEVVVGGQVVASATGLEIEPLQAVSLDLSTWLGSSAHLRVVDRHTGPWGHVNVDRIIFSDRPIRQQDIPDRPDGGTFVLAALDESSVVRPSIADWSTTASWFDSGPGPVEVAGNSSGQAGAVTITAKLKAGESRTFRYVLGWHFPTPERRLFAELVGAPTLRRHYAVRFATAAEVVHHVARHLARLENDTRAWVRTWYEDSSLPYWFCERTLAPASTLATNTCYRWQDGRFYAFEGSYLYAGTCGHVWNYAQAVGRLFPDLERDTRERVDLGIAMRPTGEIANRGESRDDASSFVDGQAGTILRIYREHQMTADNAFLTRVWPKVRMALEFLVTQRDVDGNGMLQGAQWNTLDTPFTGDVPWLSGLYVAALRAGAAMAAELGDTATKERYTHLADAGTQFISTTLWNDEVKYFVQHVGTPATNTNRGCFIDQTYGQTYAAQLGLPRVLPADQTRSALGSIVRNNHLPSPRDHQSPAIAGGRIYSTSGEAGTMMCTWPIGGDTEARSGGYFNEVWTGQEYQLAAGLFAEGMTTEALGVTRSVYDRYHASKRNPYNEVEAGDHYARAMMSYGTYLAACGYEYHGPKGHLGFAPRLDPERFRCAFTAARGWGLYRQDRQPGKQICTVDLRSGELRLATLAFETATRASSVAVRIAGKERSATLSADGTRAVVKLRTPITLRKGQSIEVRLRLSGGTS
ncbi:GH116 family glycosyl hydrolase [Tenggerimyces flavus]|uniref:GH116 family glycosyl hydrolase n=1 Tax=Tenggerimyces flavus TaxID=1708749 RepID=A0ABV7YJP7_9ACTN|nr:GH116 family glycosyl hydrolase [Tenggerimyces flavus]MBM7789705.1 uncharacterized protein (DUF608 family) [Tenggerimyces flavus]